MKTQINRGMIRNTDAKKICTEIDGECIGFNRDYDVNDYANFKTDEHIYSNRKAEVNKRKKGECFAVFLLEKTDIYEIVLAVTLKDTGMDKFIKPPR